jgi:hypothetical protein
MNFYDPTGRPKITVSRPAPQWAASTWRAEDGDFGIPARWEWSFTET